jgi:chaperone required for assembly of F1-ATPase
MTGWAAKRFWTDVTVAGESGRHTVLLDGRPIRTPLKAPLALPTADLARAVAAEWERQEDVIRPDTMPMTRLANTVIDRVVPAQAAVAGIVAAYGETDLLCYRADAPAELRTIEAEAWDPLLDWAAETLGARLVPTSGVVPVSQSEAALANLSAAVGALSAWHVAALHELVSLTGSLVMGLAVLRQARAADAVWALSRVDEEWQSAQWGRDEEADAAAARRRAEYMDAVRFARLVGPIG